MDEDSNIPENFFAGWNYKSTLQTTTPGVELYLYYKLPWREGCQGYPNGNQGQGVESNLENINYTQVQ